MDQLTLNQWYYDKALEWYSGDHIGRAYAGNEYDGIAGADAIRHAVLSAASRRITELPNSGDAVSRFNNVVEDWPHVARAELARYEAENTDRDNPSDYIDRCRTFAESEGVEDAGYTDSIDTALYYDRNPFLDEDLSRGNAEIVLGLRLCDDSPNPDEIDAVLSDATSWVSYRSALYETADPVMAIVRSQFDSRIPGDLVPDLDHPDDWDEDPSHVDYRTCYWCDTRYYRVQIDDEMVWADENNTVSFEDLSEIGGFFIAGLDPTGGSHLCSMCQEEAEESPSVNKFTNTGDGVFAVDSWNGIHYDISDEIAAAEPVARATIEEVDLITGDMLGGETEYFELGADTNGTDADASDIEDALDHLAMNPDELPTGIAMRQHRSLGSAYYVLAFERSNFDGAERAKHILEHPQQYLPSNDDEEQVALPDFDTLVATSENGQQRIALENFSHEIEASNNYGTVLTDE
jgi:hypothetical protein